MKYKLNNIEVVKLALGLVSVGAVAGFAFGIATFLQVNRQIDAGERNADFTEALVGAARINVLLHEMNAGGAELAKKSLSSELAYNLETINRLAPAENAAEQQFASVITAQIARDEKRHPEYYLAFNQSKHL